VSFEIGDWDSVLYDIPYPLGKFTNSHLKAHWLQGGTWIEVHLSLTAATPSAETRDKLMALFKAFVVAEKP
jgi:hypothetical protein